MKYPFHIVSTWHYRFLGRQVSYWLIQVRNLPITQLKVSWSKFLNFLQLVAMYYVQKFFMSWVRFACRACLCFSKENQWVGRSVRMCRKLIQQREANRKTTFYDLAKVSMGNRMEQIVFVVIVVVVVVIFVVVVVFNVVIVVVVVVVFVLLSSLLQFPLTIFKTKFLERVTCQKDITSLSFRC